MRIFLLSLTALFAPLLVVFIILRVDAGAWPPVGMPPPPHGLWLSTAVLLGVSATMHLALRSVRHDGIIRLRRCMILTTLLALAFLLNQARCWAIMLHGDIAHAAWRFAGFFYFFTVIHALHVIGGFAPLILVTARSFRNGYSRHRYNGVRFCTMYWHFLDGVWLVMFAAMILPG